jgi:hypothetical protein
MIVYVPEGGRFLDCTQKSSDFRGAPGGLGGFQALVLDDDRSRLVALPKAGESQLSITREAETAGENGVQVRETVEITGEYAAGMRSFLRDTEPTHRREMLQQYLKGHEPALEIRTAEFEQLDEPARPLRIKLEATVPRKTRLIGERLLLDVPILWEEGPLTASAIERRTTPFRVESAVRIQTTTRLKVPAGWRYTASAPVETKREFVQGGVKAQLKEGVIQFEGNVLIRAGIFPADKYAAFVKEMGECKTMVGPELLLEKEAGR